MSSGNLHHQRPNAVSTRGFPLWLLVVSSIPFLAFLTIPLVALILHTSVVHLLESIFDPHVAEAIVLSISTTLVTTVLAVIFGTPVAYLIARHQFLGRSFVDTIIDLPMVLSPAVAGVALLMAFGRQGIFGSLLQNLGIRIAFTQVAVVLAQLFVASSFYIKSAVQGFAGIDREIEHAAAMDGASAFHVFRRVTIPLAIPSLFGGVLMTWARALGEFGATIIFAGNFPGRTQTMPLAIYIGFEIDFSVALTLAVVLLAVSFVIIFLLKKILHDRMFLV